MKIEVGKTYRTRDGMVTDFVEHLPMELRKNVWSKEIPFVVKIGDDISFIQPDGFQEPIEIKGGRQETPDDLVEEIV